MIMRRLASILIGALLALGGTVAMAQEYVPTPVTVSKEKVKLNGKVYLSHVVLERQTLYGIANAYGVKVDEIYDANPTLRQTGLQKNAIILVPYKEGILDEKPVDSNAYTEHVVKWYEDLDDIANTYNVSVKAIMEVNRLTSKKVEARQVLIIPVAAVKDNVANQEVAVDVVKEEVAIAEETPTIQDSVEVVFTGPQIAPKDVVTASLVLPFQATVKPNEVQMDFYSGALLALKDLDAQGIKVNLRVYDFLSSIPPVDALTSSDFVLGPVASNDLESILQRVGGKVHVISPLDPKAASLAANYSSFIQAPSPAENQYDDLALWLKEDAQENEKIILITEKNATNTTAAVAIRSAMARQDINYEILNYALVESRSIRENLRKLMAEKTVNRVVVASESEAFTNDVVLHLNILRGKGYKVVMYAPSKVRTFDTIDVQMYHDLSLHLTTSYFVDYTSPEVISFVRRYRALFNTEPSQFAFHGYDTMMHFITWVAKYGDGWAFMLEHGRSKGLHMDFEFDTDENGNRQNKAVRRVFYHPNYTTTLE